MLDRRAFVSFVIVLAAILTPLPGYATCASWAHATTLNNTAIITQPDVWTFTGLSLTISKNFNDSDLLYTNQITWGFPNQNPPLTYGAQFRMIVIDARGNSIMPPMETRGIAPTMGAATNAMMSDTVYDVLTNNQPPAGTYTFQLWALSGGPPLQVFQYMSNIAVIEVPRPGCLN